MADTYEDPDHDGLWNRYEYLAGTNPRKKDTNGNGVKDGAEDPDHDGLSNAREQAARTYPRRADSDGDGIRDDREDPDGDGLWNITEFRAGTNPRDADSDNDGLRDGIEGTRDDGLANGIEQKVGTNPALADTDHDGVPDGSEDPDADGLTTLQEVVRDFDPRDADSNDDGTLDGAEPMPAADAPQVAGAPDCTVFPADNVWNKPVDGLSVASNSSTLISTIGSSRSFHMDFGSYAGYGIPYQVVDGTTPLRNVAFDYADESDAGPYPIPVTPLVEGGLGRPHAHGRPGQLQAVRAVRRPPDRERRAGTRARARSGTSRRTRCARMAGPRRTRPACRSCPAWSATTRSRPAPSTMRSGSRSRRRATRTSTRRRTRRRRSSSASLPPMGLRVRLKAGATSPACRPTRR